MKIVGIAACTSGIAHTYIAREKLLKGAESLGHTIHVETQGTIGTENELTSADIAEADVVIIAADIKVSGKERFTDKRVVEIPTSMVIKAPKALINKIEEELNRTSGEK
ncbi:PTS fructose transporter subunit IIB [uncultured Vagococcus sp.]|uniref:PTS fructose transporter subunit IIB n=1 Tax=uncultured Vagococcus sp. TaxID=189676 RepID=UPI0028D13537|nr:PTS fructose transporter subunit IIB [uncultured Vagococcus sp.]